MQPVPSAFCLAFASAGISMAARIAMIAITTSNSMRVKPSGRTEGGVEDPFDDVGFFILLMSQPPRNHADADSVTNGDINNKYRLLNGLMSIPFFGGTFINGDTLSGLHFASGSYLIGGRRGVPSLPKPVKTLLCSFSVLRTCSAAIPGCRIAVLSSLRGFFFHNRLGGPGSKAVDKNVGDTAARNGCATLNTDQRGAPHLPTAAARNRYPTGNRKEGRVKFCATQGVNGAFLDTSKRG